MVPSVPSIFNFGLVFFFLTGTHDFAQDESDRCAMFIMFCSLAMMYFSPIEALDFCVFTHIFNQLRNKSSHMILKVQL